MCDIDGADGQFGLDHLCISYREAIEAVDRIGLVGSLAMVPHDPSLVEPYARPDLVVADSQALFPKVNYYLSCTSRGDEVDPAAFKDVYDVVRGKAVLTQGWQRIKSPR